MFNLLTQIFNFFYACTFVHYKACEALCIDMLTGHIHISGGGGVSMDLRAGRNVVAVADPGGSVV